MKLSIGSTTLEITNCEPQRDLKLGTYLAIKIPKDNITEAEIDALFDGNKEVIIITKDDGTEKAYRGFGGLGGFERANGYYNIKQYCDSDLWLQISLLQNQQTAQEETNTATAQQINALAETNVTQLSAIDVIMTEVLPAAITVAVTQAVELATERVLALIQPEEDVYNEESVTEETAETIEE